MRRSLAPGVWLFLPVAVLLGQTVPDHDPRAQDELARIVGASMLSGGASEFLERLTDTIGGRITGSAESYRTSELILNTLKEAGFDNAHFEQFEINPGWQHGPVSGQVTSPVH